MDDTRTRARPNLSESAGKIDHGNAEGGWRSGQLCYQAQDKKLTFPRLYWDECFRTKLIDDTLGEMSSATEESLLMLQLPV